jgi:hypothetical protein
VACGKGACRPHGCATDPRPHPVTKTKPKALLVAFALSSPGVLLIRHGTWTSNRQPPSSDDGIAPAGLCPSHALFPAAKRKVLCPTLPCNERVTMISAAGAACARTVRTGLHQLSSSTNWTSTNPMLLVADLTVSLFLVLLLRAQVLQVRNVADQMGPSHSG